MFLTSYQYIFKGVSVDLEEGLEVFTDEGLKTDVFKVKWLQNSLRMMEIQVQIQGKTQRHC